MPLPLRCAAGAVDGGQWHSFPVPRKKPGPPALPPGAPAEGCSACPALSVLRLHLADLRGVLPTRLGSRTNVAHAAPPTRLPPPIRPDTYARSQSLLCSFPWPSHPAGRARTAEAPGSPPINVLLCSTERCPQCARGAPMHAALSQSHCSTSLLLLFLHPAPQYTKESYKMGLFVFFFFSFTGIKS